MIELARDAQHLRIAHAPRIGKRRQRISAQRRLGEHIDLDEVEAFSRDRLRLRREARRRRAPAMAAARKSLRFMTIAFAFKP